MEDAKFYGLCLVRLRHQVKNARLKKPDQDGTILMECYRTGDPGDIVDILELYDIEDRTPEIIMEKLEELAYTASILIRENLIFDYNSEGHLGLYLKLKQSDIYTDAGPYRSLTGTGVG